MSFFFWGRWEQTIPGKCHSEEMGEALLARLVEKVQLNPNSSPLDEFFDLFLITPAARTDLKDVHGSHLQHDTIKLVRRNLNTFVRQISDGQLVSPVLWKSKVPTVDLDLTNGKVVVLWNTGSGATNEDNDDTGTKILSAPIIHGRGVLATFAPRPYTAVCSIPCRFCSQ